MLFSKMSNNDPKISTNSTQIDLTFTYYLLLLSHVAKQALQSTLFSTFSVYSKSWQTGKSCVYYFLLLFNIRSPLPQCLWPPNLAVW